jgi:hypothetical protein
VSPLTSFEVRPDLSRQLILDRITRLSQLDEQTEDVPSLPWRFDLLLKEGIHAKSALVILGRKERT